MEGAGAELEEETRLANFPRRPKSRGRIGELCLSPFPPCQCHRWRPRDWTIQFDRFIVAFVEPLDEFRKYPSFPCPYLPPFLTYPADLSSVSDWTRPV